jgi:hypothetical protein
VHRSLHRLGQLLVVMAALLRAVLRVALALIVENAETSRAVLRIQRTAAIPPARSARRQPAEPTSVLGRLTRRARAAETRPAATARGNPARATTSRERLPRCLWWLGGRGRSVAPRRCAGRAAASREGSVSASTDEPARGRRLPVQRSAQQKLVCGCQRGGSPSGRNQSLLAGAGDSGWTDASGWPGGAVTASRSWSLIGSCSTRNSCCCPASVSVTTSVTR